MLKKFFVTIASMMALGSFAGTLEPLVYPPIQDSVSLEPVKHPKRQFIKKAAHVGAPQELISQPGFYFENFEYGEGGELLDLPDGWKSVANPSDNNDVWRIGTLANAESMIAGTSGSKYAFILGTGAPHDSWAISPLIDMEEGEEYEISFFHMFVSGERRIEKLEIVILPTQDITAKPITRFNVQDNDRTGKWYQFIQSFVAKSDGQFCVGLHSTGGGETNTGHFWTISKSLMDIAQPRAHPHISIWARNSTLMLPLSLLTVSTTTVPHPLRFHSSPCARR